MTQRIFITGGAGGLGREMAALWAARGARVLIGDIDLLAAQTTAAEIGATAIRCDVTSAEDFAQVADWIAESWGGLDVLVNNAGVALMGPMDRTSAQDWQWAININVLGIVRACETLLPLIGSGGRVLNIASMAAMLHLPGAAAYSATKAAVLAISETLMLELEPRDISVQVACPAFFRTDLAKNMRASDAQSARVTARLVERSRLGASEIAAMILSGFDKGDRHIFTHPNSRRAWLFKRYLPFGLFLGMMRKQLKKLESRLARPSGGTP